MFSEADHTLKLGHFHFPAKAWTFSFLSQSTIHFHFLKQTTKTNQDGGGGGAAWEGRQGHEEKLAETQSQVTYTILTFT